MNINLQILIDKVRRDKGLDLSGYKESTLQRRIERRIKFDGTGSLKEYMRMIDRDHHLYWRLISDFFIGVTDFFRDKEIWDIVQGEVLPGIIARRSSFVNRNIRNTLHETRFTRYASRIKLPIRIWSAGCSTGEETYSLAIAFKEVLRTPNYQLPTTSLLFLSMEPIYLKISLLLQKREYIRREK